MKSDFFWVILDSHLSFSSCQRNLIKTFQIEGMICTDHKNGMLLKKYWIFVFSFMYLAPVDPMGRSLITKTEK